MNAMALRAAVESIRAHSACAPQVGVVLGSGLGVLAEMVTQATTIPYDAITAFPRTSVDGHEGRLVLGMIGATPAAMLQGRVHLYEGATPDDVARPVRTLVALGARVIVLTNAAGGVNPAFEPGDLMCIDDHINLQGSNPLTGPNDDVYGPRFPDMSAVYDPALRALLDRAAHAERITLRHGVYAGMPGPAYETPAEVRMLRTLGADAVGMSTVAEALAARHMGARVCGVSLISNKAAGLSGEPLTHDDVKRVAALAAADCTRLLRRALAEMTNTV